MRTTVIGDVHGCLEELDELLAILEPRAEDRLISLGPDPVGVVRRVRALGAECLMGNHEEKHLRWARHEAKRQAQPGYKNPIRPFEGERLAQHDALGAENLAWMARLPTVLRLSRGGSRCIAASSPRALSMSSETA